MVKNKYLVSFRESKLLTVGQMAKKLGVSKSFYEKIEYGIRNPSFNFIQKFHKAYKDADINQIFLPSNYTKCVGL
jgi:transcriptional regulator with XRE-family HTH domain